jgi:type II secretory pathway component GspD/PulD (secretin)
MRVAIGVAGVMLLMTGSGLWAQGTETETKAKPAVITEGPNMNPVETFYLTNASQVSESNEIVTAVRNLLDPRMKLYLVTSQNAIVVQAPPDQLELVRRLLKDLDRPKKTYRLTYAITEMDGGKRIGTQKYAIIVVGGQRTMLKQGSKIPVVTGMYNSGAQNSQTQMTYLDVGMNFDATLDEFANGVRLRTKVEQSSIAEEKSSVGAQDPIVRQTVLEGTSFLTPGKPLVLGSLDIPGSTRHMDIDVMMELVP